MKLRGLFVVLSALALAGNSCTRGSDSRARTEVQGVKLVPGPTVTVTVQPKASPPPPHVEPPRPAIRSAAVYSLSLRCVETISPRGSTRVRAMEPKPVEAGTRFSYEFQYRRDAYRDPAAQLTERCTMKTMRIHSGTEPRLAVMLGCVGEATYSAHPRPTSAVAQSWRTPSDLLDGYTHTMAAPKSPDQLTETVRCTLAVVNP